MTCDLLDDKRDEADRLRKDAWREYDDAVKMDSEGCVLCGAPIEILHPLGWLCRSCDDKQAR